MDVVTVGFDGGCGPCTRIWHLVELLDLGRGHVVGVDVNDPAAVAGSPLAGQDLVALVLDMHARSGEEVTVGLEAWRTVAAAVPLLWPLLIVLRFPGSTWIGTRVYRRVADSRSCAVQRHESGVAVRSG
jgi:predicted DCC family thiol-disulfide oxidoreductase YuxK